MRIAVMGAGGIGAYVGARLAVSGEDVAFIARGAHLAAMRADGLTVLSPYGDVKLAVEASDNPADIGVVDLVLFTVKLWDADSAAAALAPMIGPRTRLLTLLNGVDSMEILARYVPRAQVVGGVIYVPAVIEKPGVIRASGGNNRIIADSHGADSHENDPVMVALAEAGTRAVGLEIQLTDDIDSVIWQKFVRFAAFSAATTLLRTRRGPVLANPETRAFLRQLVEEGTRIATAEGHAPPSDFVDATMEFYAAFSPDVRASMAADLERGARLELDWISGRIHALGLKHGIATPAHTAAYRGLILYANGVPPAG